MPTDLKSLVVPFQQLNILISALTTALSKGVAIDPTPAVFTVATLPATGANGQFAFASNARKAGQGAGAGTGLPVYYDTAAGAWLTYAGAALTV